MLHQCYRAGFREDLFLADDIDTPIDLAQTYSLATDDVMIFTQGDESLARTTVGRLDKTLARAGIVRAEEKDVTAEISDTGVTCIGVDICQGIFLAPHNKKLCKIIAGMLGFVMRPRREVTPDGLAALLGHFSWFAQLNRPLYSCFDTVYDFTRLEGPDVARNLPESCMHECLLFTCLLPMLEADLRRDWSTTLLATDASVNFGFGVSAAHISTAEARTIGWLADSTGAYVRLDRSVPHPDDEAERPRKGIAHHLGLSKHSFTSIISSRKRHKAHSGALEATGLSMGVRWFLRKRSNHCKRLPILVDAQAVIGSAAKGRTSAPTTKREIRHLGAMVVAGELLLRLIYTPS